MLINAQAFSALSSGITSMRKNVIALRKTIKTNQSKQAKSKIKTKLLERKEVEGEKRRKVEEDRESKKQTKNLGESSFFKKPELAMKLPGSNIFGNILSFFSFVMIGWMLKTLPQIKKSVEEFIEKAKEFLKSLEGLWNTVKDFFSTIWGGIDELWKTLGFGGTEGLQKGDDDKVKTVLESMTDLLKGFIQKIPGLMIDFVKELVFKLKKANYNKLSEEEKREVDEYENARGTIAGTTPTAFMGATFGETGNVSQAAGWVHGHFQTNTGTREDLIKDVTPIVRKLLAQGVPLELADGTQFRTNMDNQEIRDMILRGIDLHTHSGDGRSVDIFMPEGTNVPVPLSNVSTRPGGAEGRAGTLPGTGKVWVGHLTPGSTSGSPAPTPSPNGSSLTPAQVIPLGGDLEGMSIVPASSSVGSNPAPRQEAATELAANSNPQRIVIRRDVDVVVPDPNIDRNRDSDLSAAFAAAGKIEIVSLDGYQTQEGLFG